MEGRAKEIGRWTTRESSTG